MIAIYTDAYANRPWCRRELSLARTPAPCTTPDPKQGPDQAADGRGDPGTGAGDTPHWRAKPLLIVGALEQGNTRFLPEAGFAPLVNWQPEDPGAIIDRLLRELVLSAYNEERAALLPTAPGRYTLNCQPDLRMVRHLVRRAPDLTELLVPPPGLADQDRGEIEDLARGANPIRIRTFNEVEA
jgi:hypothetical protein